MKILSQNHETIFEMPKSIWITQSGLEGKWIVVASGNSSIPCVGIYENHERARAVLRDIFIAYGKNESVFEMPEK